jgi:hypothetical protein
MMDTRNHVPPPFSHVPPAGVNPMIHWPIAARDWKIGGRLERIENCEFTLQKTGARCQGLSLRGVPASILACSPGAARDGSASGLVGFDTESRPLND